MYLPDTSFYVRKIFLYYIWWLPNLSVKKIWITNIQAYMPLSQKETHQTNPMAPWDALEAPLEPVEPRRPQTPRPPWTPKQPS